MAVVLLGGGAAFGRADNVEAALYTI